MNGEIQSLLMAENRPEPHIVAAHIENGLTDNDIVEAGVSFNIPQPEMSVTLDELPTTLHYARIALKHLHESQHDKRKVFLARDSDLLYDNYAITHPDEESVLLPASMDLWYSSENSDAGKQFLAQQGISYETAANHYMVDTGFKGTAGYWVWENLIRDRDEDVYDLKEAMPIGLISAIGLEHLRWGNQIVDFNDDASLANNPFPKVAAFHGYRDRQRSGFDPVAHATATSLQTLPRHHGSYDHFEQSPDGTIVAKPRYEAFQHDIDMIDTRENAGRNASIVNPVAALIVQRHVVMDALVRG